MFDFTDEQVEAAPKVESLLSNSTVVSLLPYPLKENKPAIIPGYFQIPASRNGIPSVLQVGDSIHWLESPFGGNPPPPPIKMTHSSREIAKALVNDFIEAQLAIESDCMPGIFWVEGHYTSKEITEHHKTRLKEATDRQFRWFSALVRIADDDWAKYGQHKFISDLQRYAARDLKLNREWLTTLQSEIQVKCPLCGDYVRGDAIVHNMCGYIMKPDDYMLMKVKGLIVAKEDR